MSGLASAYEAQPGGVTVQSHPAPNPIGAEGRIRCGEPCRSQFVPRGDD